LMPVMVQLFQFTLSIIAASMDTLIKILVGDDGMIIGAKISMQLTSLGYEGTGILSRGEEAIIHVEEINQIPKMEK
jgi:hypothetical protein